MAEKPSNRSMGWMALALNLGATPGLGSYLAGRRVVGVLQMAMAVSGFVALMAWFWDLARLAWDAVQTGDSVTWPTSRGWLWGGVLFLGSWLWSLATSLQILRDIRRATPPLLNDPSASRDPGANRD
jgi:hypothetical protein